MNIYIFFYVYTNGICTDTDYQYLHITLYSFNPLKSKHLLCEHITQLVVVVVRFFFLLFSLLFLFYCVLFGCKSNYIFFSLLYVIGLRHTIYSRKFRGRKCTQFIKHWKMLTHLLTIDLI